MQSCQSQDTCSQQEGYLPTARSLDMVSGNKMIFPSEICLPQWLMLLGLTTNLWYQYEAEKHGRRALKKKFWWVIDIVILKLIFSAGRVFISWVTSAKGTVFKRFLKYGSFLKSLLNLLWYCLCFMFCFFGCEACGIFTPWPGIDQRSNLYPLASEAEALTTELPGKVLMH